MEFEGSLSLSVPLSLLPHLKLKLKPQTPGGPETQPPLTICRKVISSMMV